MMEKGFRISEKSHSKETYSFYGEHKLSSFILTMKSQPDQLKAKYLYPLNLFLIYYFWINKAHFLDFQI